MSGSDLLEAQPLGQSQSDLRPELEQQLQKLLKCSEIEPAWQSLPFLKLPFREPQQPWVTPASTLPPFMHLQASTEATTARRAKKLVSFILDVKNVLMRIGVVEGVKR